MRAIGLDVSSCQGDVDWVKVASQGFAFAIRKVSEGTSGRDTTGPSNASGIRNAGLIDGVYHFIRISQGHEEDQIRNLWEAVGDKLPMIRPALDLEAAGTNITPDQLVDMFLRMADLAEEYFGVPPMIYTFPWFEQTRIAPALKGYTCDRIARCPLWMADYSGGEVPSNPWRPVVPAPWQDWAFAQTSGNNSSYVPGVPGRVDHNVFNGDRSDLLRFCGLTESDP